MFKYTRMAPIVIGIQRPTALIVAARRLRNPNPPRWIHSVSAQPRVDPRADTTQAAPVQRTLNILVVDDDSDNANATAMVLEARRHRCTAVYDGHEAIAQHGRGGFDLVLLDVDMPQPNGFEVLEAIRARDGETPVIMLTGNAGTRDYAPELLKMGATAVLKKPVVPNDLITEVGKASDHGSR